MRKNLRGRKATAIALASVMAMSLAACGKQDGSNQGGQTEQKEYVYVPEYLELDDNTNSSYSNMTVQGDKLYYTNYQWDEASGESKVVLGAYSLTDGSREDLPPLMLTAVGSIPCRQTQKVIFILRNLSGMPQKVMTLIHSRRRYCTSTMHPVRN
mgnify:CR=1 FL=1